MWFKCIFVNSGAADLAHSVYGEVGKRELAQVLRQMAFTKDCTWPWGCGIIPSAPCMPGSPWESPPFPLREHVAQFEDSCTQCVAMQDLGQDSSASVQCFPHLFRLFAKALWTFKLSTEQYHAQKISFPGKDDTCYILLTQRTLSLTPLLEVTAGPLTIRDGYHPDT